LGEKKKKRGLGERVLLQTFTKGGKVRLGNYPPGEKKRSEVKKGGVKKFKDWGASEHSNFRHTVWGLGKPVSGRRTTGKKVTSGGRSDHRMNSRSLGTPGGTLLRSSRNAHKSARRGLSYTGGKPKQPSETAKGLKGSA